MRKLNIFLLIVLIIAAGAIAYLYLGTDINVQATAARDGENMNVTLALENKTPFKYEWLSFTAVKPEGATISKCDLYGTDLPSFESAQTSITVLNAPESCEIEIGYYLLGMWKTKTVRIK